eukprot:jgi/Chlat1/590/Chrsp103S00953
MTTSPASRTHTYSSGWLNASKTRLTNIKTFPLFNREPSYGLNAVQGLQVDSVHGRLYVGYEALDGLIMTVRNTRTDNLDSVVTKLLGTIDVFNFPRINIYAGVECRA